MCGIFFSVGFENLPAAVIDSVAYRGPDGRGWNDFSSPQGPVVMAHRRLAIVDLSAEGHQPRETEDRRFWVTFNGEIYNYQEIRRELESLGHSFRSKTDTEVLLKSYLQWGSACLHRFNGMFAFVIWDDVEKKFFAARDRFGVKPLYYYRQGDKMAFASEVKQLLHIPGVPRRLNQDHLSFFMTHRHHPLSDTTLFNDIRHVEPGHYVTYDFKNYQTTAWYVPHPARRTKESDTEEFLELFQDAIRKRLIADVSVGALLSGGLDSSSIVCMIAELSKTDPSYKAIETFTSWSPDPRVDEKVYSDAVIAQTGLANHLAEIKNDALQGDIEKIIFHQEEPFLSTSIQSEWNIYKTISDKTKLKVVLDGQGSDELMCGYLFMIPHVLSHYMKRRAFYRAAQEFLYTIKNHADLSAKTLAMDTFLQTYPQFVTWLQHLRGRNMAPGGAEEFDTFQDYTMHLIRRSIEPQLRWQDRSSMAFSIESRQPFLDYRLVEFLLSVPLEEKFNKGRTKAILRDSMKGILPEVVRNRVSKFGFPSPQDTLIKTLDQDYFKAYFQKGQEMMEHVFPIDQMSHQAFFAFSLGLWAEQFQVTS